MRVLLRPHFVNRVLFIAIASLLLILDDVAGDDGRDAGRIALLLCLTIAIAGIVPLPEDRRWMPRVRPPAVRTVAAWLVAAISLAVASFGAEAATRWVYRDVTTIRDGRGYFSAHWERDSGEVRWNANGFRDREWSSTRPAGVFRVAIVGDSFTFGNGVAQRERFTDLLQGSLGNRVEVMNLGVQGHNTPQHVDTLRWSVSHLGPDFVLVQWFVNDVEGTNLDARPVKHSLAPWTFPHDWLRYHSAFYTLLNEHWGDWQERWLSESYAAYLQRRFGDPQSAASLADEAAVSSLFSVARSNHVGLGIVLFPETGYDLGAAYPFAFLHARVLDACAAHGITCLDLRAAFAALPDRTKLWVNPWDHHPSALANAIAAERILAAFGPRFLEGTVR